MNNQIGTVISQCRQNQRMTQEDFASRLGVTPQAVSKWERGSGLPDVALLGDICRLLQISADTLLGVQLSPIMENNSPVLEREIRSCMIAEPLVLEFGTGLVPCVAEGMKTDLIYQARKELAAQTGMLLPLVHIRDNGALNKQEYRILSYDRVLFQGEEKPDSDNAACFGRMIQQVCEQCRQHYDQILNKQLVKILVDNVKARFPGVADGLIPERIGYLTLERHLRKILREKGSIRDLIHILEELEAALEKY
ncbi:MAG: FHIPEP family type III secretion protein [Roseburia sp.]|nr:FHIPEP family type III secretion protein [Roseburia sp.]